MTINVGQLPPLPSAFPASNPFDPAAIVIPKVLSQGLDYLSWQSSAEKGFAPTFPTVSGTGASCGFSSFKGWPTVRGTTASNTGVTINIPWPTSPWFSPRTGTFTGLTLTWYMGYSAYTPGFGGLALVPAVIQMQTELWQVEHDLSYNNTIGTTEIISFFGTQVLNRPWSGTFGLNKYSVTIGTDGTARGYLNDTLVYTSSPVYTNPTAFTPTFSVQASGPFQFTAHAGNVYMAYS